MIFGKIRRFQELKKVPKQYLRYALGELVLIVLGVLIAVSIDNWNEDRIKEKAIDAVLLKIGKDLDEDLIEIQNIQTHYDIRKPLFDRLMKGEYQEKSLVNCKECHFLISGHRLFRPNTEGYTSLKNTLNNSSIVDSELVYFIQSYTTLLEELDLMSNNIVEDVNGNLMGWRDNYDWFTSFFEGKNENGYLNYRLKNPEYRNKVTYHYALVYNNYLPVLENFKTLSNEFRAIVERK